MGLELSLSLARRRPGWKGERLLSLSRELAAGVAVADAAAEALALVESRVRARRVRSGERMVRPRDWVKVGEGEVWNAEVGGGSVVGQAWWLGGNDGRECSGLFDCDDVLAQHT